MHRCNATVTFGSVSLPVTNNDKRLHSHFRGVAERMVGAENVHESAQLMGGEDFSFYQEAVPGCFISVGMKDETKGVFESGHSPFFRVNEDALPYGAALYASVAATYLLENRTGIANESSHDEL